MKGLIKKKKIYMIVTFVKKFFVARAFSLALAMPGGIVFYDNWKLFHGVYKAGK